MSKKILVLETSVTLQKLFTTTLGDEHNVQFIGDGKEALYRLFELSPDLFLLNAEFEEPRSFDLVRVVRSIPCFKDLSIGMYATGPFPFDEAMAKGCGANSFVRIDQKTMALNIEELAQMPSSRLDKLELTQARKDLDDGRLFQSALSLLKDGSFKNVVLEKIIEMSNSMESVEAIVTDFLSLIVSICEIPAAGLFIVENDGPHGYYRC